MKNRFLLLVNKLWKKQPLFIEKMNHFLNPLKPLKNARQHCRMSFRAPAIAGVIISTVTVLSITTDWMCTKHEHFGIDYSKSNGQEGTYKGYTVDKFRYPDAPRLHNQNYSVASVFVRRIKAQRFLYLTGMFANQLSVYHFDGEIAVPSAIFARNHSTWPTNQPATGSWLWYDKNGDGSIQTNEYESLGAEDDSIWGWEVDSNGDVWQASESGAIGHYHFQGLDTYGTPIYNAATSEKIPMPEPFKSLARIKYFPETDTMYLTGYTTERPHIGKEWGTVGTEIVRYDNWSQSRNIRWRLTLPYQPSAHPDPAAKDFLVIKAIDIAGDRIFATRVLQAEVYSISYKGEVQ
jgi:hypothetical protein